MSDNAEKYEMLECIERNKNNLRDIDYKTMLDIVAKMETVRHPYKMKLIMTDTRYCNERQLILTELITKYFDIRISRKTIDFIVKNENREFDQYFVNQIEDEADKLYLTNILISLEHKRDNIEEIEDDVSVVIRNTINIIS